MPGYKGHLVGGSVAFALLVCAMQFKHPSFPLMAEWFICCLAGSLFPDIDVKSKGQNYFYKLMLIILAGLLLKGYTQLFMLLSGMALIPMVMRHRGMLHKLWFIISFSFCVTFLVGMYYPAYASMLFFDVLFFIAGAISHLWLDLGLRKMLRF